jgi:hypothetical protein
MFKLLAIQAAHGTKMNSALSFPARTGRRAGSAAMATRGCHTICGRRWRDAAAGRGANQQEVDGAMASQGAPSARWPARRRDWTKIAVAIFALAQAVLFVSKPFGWKSIFQVGVLALLSLPLIQRTAALPWAVRRLRRDLQRANPGAPVWTGLALPGLGSALAELGIANRWLSVQAGELDKESAPEEADSAEDDEEIEAENRQNAIIGLLVTGGRLRLMDSLAREVASFSLAALGPATVGEAPNGTNSWLIRPCVMLNLADRSVRLPFAPGTQVGPPIPRTAQLVADSAAEINEEFLGEDATGE